MTAICPTQTNIFCPAISLVVAQIRNLGDREILKHGLQGQLNAMFLSNPRQYTHGRKGVSTKVEKSVVRSYLTQAKQITPNLRNCSLQGRGRRYIRPFTFQISGERIG